MIVENSNGKYTLSSIQYDKSIIQELLKNSLENLDKFYGFRISKIVTNNHNLKNYEIPLEEPSFENYLLFSIDMEQDALFDLVLNIDTVKKGLLLMKIDFPIANQKIRDGNFNMDIANSFLQLALSDFEIYYRDKNG